jgi:hypothetical protein
MPVIKAATLQYKIPLLEKILLILEVKPEVAVGIFDNAEQVG